MKQHKGVALILVLWLVALLSLMAASYGLGIRREASLAAIQVRDARLLAACEAGIHYAAYMVKHPDPQLKWPADGTLQHWQWDGIALDLRPLDESGKADINHAGPVLLKAVLGLAGAAPEQVDSLADAIMDWRDNDQLRRTSGAESPDYIAAGLAYGPSDKPFQSMEELSMVLGMEPTLFAKLMPWVTIYNKRNGINPAVAPAELLRSLPGLDPQLVEMFVQARELGSSEGQPAVALPKVEGVPFFASLGQTYTVLVQASDQGKRLSIYTVVRFLKDRLRYLAWREGVPKSLFEEPPAENPGAASPADVNSSRSAISPAAMTR